MTVSPKNSGAPKPYARSGHTIQLSKGMARQRGLLHGWKNTDICSYSITIVSRRVKGRVSLTARLDLHIPTDHPVLVLRKRFEVAR